MLARIRSLISANWRTVGYACRSTTFAGTAYPLHGMVDRSAVKVSYRLLLQESPRGRRRLDIECANRAASRSDLKRDPLAQAARAWVRGGVMPDAFLPTPA